ncbi:hypothetical protein BDW22DRAFT_1093679 [Trametopsis cervina]|nr:hypothetical protein BDW22DRAFT_1093679 [Trametopsis cervina]
MCRRRDVIALRCALHGTAWQCVYCFTLGKAVSCVPGTRMARLNCCRIDTYRLIDIAEVHKQWRALSPHTQMTRRQENILRTVRAAITRACANTHVGSVLASPVVGNNYIVSITVSTKVHRLTTALLEYRECGPREKE